MKLDYFKGEIVIPNLIGDEPANAAIQQTVNDLITDYEQEFLELMMGADMYADYVVGIAAGTLKWTSLRDQIYNESTWRTPAAYYIFYKYLEQTATLLSGMGEVKGNDGNVPVGKRMIRTWNRMSDMVEAVWDWIEDDSRNSDYGGWDRSVTYTTDHNSREVSPFERMNQWGF